MPSTQRPPQPSSCGRRRPPAADSLPQQLVAQVQALKPSRVEFGADGVPITEPFESISWIASDDWRLAFAPFTVPLVKLGFDRFGSAARPTPPVPISVGVSSIHSAVA